MYYFGTNLQFLDKILKHFSAIFKTQFVRFLDAACNVDDAICNWPTFKAVYFDRALSCQARSRQGGS
jgi:hypothetical protein